MGKTAIFLTILLALNFWVEARADVIYGADDRHEASEYSDNSFIEKARSVAMRVSKRRLAEDREDPNLINFPIRKLKSLMPQLCSSEQYLEEISLGDCTGFLIAPDKLLTAGHCMNDISECAGNKWVFDFRKDTAQLKKESVYSCKKIISQKHIYNNHEVSDYAIIELDRPVLDRKPLSYRKRGRVAIGTPLVVIGNPLGLPTKIANGAQVSKMNDIERAHRFKSWLLRRDYFTANIDTYSGNSGSPVFNEDTGIVEGIVIEGHDDFEFNETSLCQESVHLSDSHHNTFEKVMRITKIPGL